MNSLVSGFSGPMVRAMGRPLARHFLIFVSMVMAVVVLACQPGETTVPVQPLPTSPITIDSSTTVSQANIADDAVTGTIAYREDVLLPPGARLEVELRDVSLTDVASTLIAQNQYAVEGKGPFPFRVEYDGSLIEPGAVYAVEARIVYESGALGFATDTAYEVITGGRPDEVDMVLVMVSPPQASPPEVTPLAGGWQVVPARIGKVETKPLDGGYLLIVTFLLPGGEDCSELHRKSVEMVDTNIDIRVTSREKLGEDGAPACATPPQQVDVEVLMDGPYTPGQRHIVRVNGVIASSFTPPPAGYENPTVAPSPVEEADLMILEKFPPAYQVRVVSALPLGSSCSSFNGYAIDRSVEGAIKIQITHHEDRNPNAACTRDRPLVDTTVPLGEDVESGREYSVDVNGRMLTLRGQ